MAVEIVQETRVLPGMAIGYPQITDSDRDTESFNRFYRILADRAEEYARACRETDGGSFYRTQCTVEEDTALRTLSVMVSIFHRTPTSTTAAAKTRSRSTSSTGSSPNISKNNP